MDGVVVVDACVQEERGAASGCRPACVRNGNAGVGSEEAGDVNERREKEEERRENDRDSIAGWITECE